MERVKFLEGEQREFLNLIIEKLNSPSLRGILQFGFDIPYSTLKNYYNESRLLPKELFEDLCEISGIDKLELEYEMIDENWGKAKGGKKSRRMCH